MEDLRRFRNRQVDVVTFLLPQFASNRYGLHLLFLLAMFLKWPNFIGCLLCLVRRTTIYCTGSFWLKHEIYLSTSVSADEKRPQDHRATCKSFFFAKAKVVKMFNNTVLNLALNLNFTLFQKLQPTCPKLLAQIFPDQAPRGHYGSGEDSTINLSKVKTAGNVEDCVTACCADLNCQMVFMYKNNSFINCYQVIDNSRAI